MIAASNNAYVRQQTQGTNQIMTWTKVISGRAGIWLIVAVSGLVTLSSYRFLGLGLALAFPDFNDHLTMRWWAFVSHVAASPLALLSGGLQLLPTIRRRWPACHRWLGRIYLAAVILGGASGLILAVAATGGNIAGLGFGLLAVLWIGFTVQGYRMARARRYWAHRVWMIRSFALTFAAVTLRLYLGGFFLIGMPYAPASVYLAWISWVPNLLFVQWWLSRPSTTAWKPGH